MKYKNIQRLTATLSDLNKSGGLMSAIKDELEEDVSKWEIISIETVNTQNGHYYFAIWIGCLNEY